MYSSIQGCDGSGVDGDDISGPAGTTKHSANNTTASGGGSNKSPSSLDFKVDVSIPMSGSFAERYNYVCLLVALHVHADDEDTYCNCMSMMALVGRDYTRIVMINAQ